MAAETTFERPSEHFGARFDETGVAARSSVVYWLASALPDIGAAFGGMVLDAGPKRFR